MQNGAATSHNSLADPYMIKYRVTIGSNNSTPRYTQEKYKQRPQKNLYINIQNSVTHNGPKMESTQMSIN